MELDVGNKNKRLIEDFIAKKRADGISEGRLKSLRGHLITASSSIADFETATEKDVTRVVNDLMTAKVKHRRVGNGSIQAFPGSYSPRTISLFKISLKAFYKWLSGGEEYPTCVKHLKSTQFKEPRVTENDVLTLEDVSKMAGAASNKRDEAFIWTLFETGARAGELLDVRVKDVAFDERGAVVTLRSEKQSKASFRKTRRTRVYWGASALAEWMNSLVDKGPESIVWVSIIQGEQRPVKMTSLWRITNLIAQRAGIKKPMSAHVFRHARATELARKMSDEAMRQYFGWSHGSQMPSVYSHLKAEAVDNELLSSVYGVEVPSENDHYGTVECMRCHRKNVRQKGVEVCACGFPLYNHGAAEAYKEQQELMGIAGIVKQLATEYPEVDAALKRAAKDRLEKMKIATQPTVFK